jgi:hypothetical protein
MDQTHPDALDETGSFPCIVDNTHLAGLVWEKFLYDNLFLCQLFSPDLMPFPSRLPGKCRWSRHPTLRNIHHGMGCDTVVDLEMSQQAHEPTLW